MNNKYYRLATIRTDKQIYQNYLTLYPIFRTRLNIGD